MTNVVDRDDRLELYLQIKSAINEGTIRTKDISKSINRSERQIRRYFVEMSKLGMITLTNTSRVAITQEQTLKHQYISISKHEFLKTPQIKKWINGCIARGLSPQTIASYLHSVKYIFNFMRISPSEVLVSRESAIDFWIDFISEFKRNRPNQGTHIFRVSYKSLLASLGITFANNVGKVFGLSSRPDK
ncbi:MAG: hypothetical protein EPO63_03640, partial [Candidatus Nitrosotenuis sp.]